LKERETTWENKFRREDNVKIGLKCSMRIWTGFMWLWIVKWHVPGEKTIGSYKRQEIAAITQQFFGLRYV